MRQRPRPAPNIRTGIWPDGGRRCTAALLGPRTIEQFDDLIAGAAVVLDGETLDRIDEIVLGSTISATTATSDRVRGFRRPELLPSWRAE